MSVLSDLSLRDQLEILTYGRSPKEDLRELAKGLRKVAPARIDFAQEQLQILGQSPEFYVSWKDSLRLWKKALRLSNPDYNIYI